MVQLDTHNDGTRSKHKLLRISGALFGLLLILVLLIPTLLSTTWGKEVIVGRINQHTSGRVTIENLNLGWFGRQEASGITISDPTGRVVATLESLKTDISPLSVLFGSHDIGNTELKGVHANLIQDDKGISNLHRALAPAVMTASSVTNRHETDLFRGQIIVEVPFTGELSISDASVSLSGPEIDPVSFNQIKGLLKSELSRGCASVTMEGLSHQEELSGHFAVEIVLQGLDQNGRLKFEPSKAGIPLPAESQGLVRLKLDIENASVDVFDQLLTLGNPQLTGFLSDALGSTLNLRLDTVLTKSGPSIQIRGDSANLRADLITELRDGKLILEKAGKLSYQVTPELFKRVTELLAPEQRPLFALKQDVDIKLNVERMTLPTRLATLDSAPTVRLKLTIDDATLVGAPEIGEVKIQNIFGLLERLEASGAYVMSLNATVTQGSQTGSVRIGGKAVDNSSGETNFSDIILTATNLPTAVIDYVAQRNSLLRDAMGSNFDLQAKARFLGKTPTAELQIGSDSFVAPSMHFDLTDGIVLSQPAQIQLQVTPPLLRDLLGSDKAFALENKASVLITLNKLEQPVNGPFRVNLDAASAPFILTSLTGPDRGRVRFSNVRLSVTDQENNNLQFALQADMAPDGVTPHLTAGLGNVSSLRVEGTFHQGHLSDTRVSLQNELMDFRTALRVTSDGLVTLASPATLRYNANPELMLSLGLIDPGVPHFVQKTPVEFRVDELTWQPGGKDSVPAHARGKVNIGKVDIVDAKQEVLATVRDANLSWRFDGTEHLAGIALNASYDGNGEEGSIHATFDISGWENHKQAVVDSDILIQKLPTVLFSAATGKNTWQNLLGDSLDACGRIHYELHDKKGVPGAMQLSLNTPDLQANAVMAFGDSTVFAKAFQPFVMTWNITPQRLEAFEEFLDYYGFTTPLPYQLEKPTTLQATINQFTVPWPTDKVNSISMQGKIALEDLVLKERVASQNHLAFDDFSLEFETSNLQKSFQFAFVGLESKSTLNGHPASLHLKGELQDLYSEEAGWFAPNAMQISLALQANELPVTSLLRYPLQQATIGQSIASLIGSHVGGNLNFQFLNGNGTIDAALEGQDGTFKLDGQIDNGILTLNEPLTLDLNVTPQLREGLLHDLTPFIALSNQEDKPIRFFIDPNGFAFPLHTSSLQAIKIPRATLDLGKIEIEGDSLLGSMVGMLKGEMGLSPKPVPVWFTPLNFSLYDGLIRFERMDAMVANIYPVAIWGKIDLVKDRIRMVLGLTAQALREAYGLNNLASNYVFQIPFTGTIDNPSVDKAKITTRITALAAQAHGSKEGAVLGNMLDLLSGAGQEDAVPPPSGPLPWVDQQTFQQSTPSNNKGIPSSFVGEELQKNLKKEAKKLLNSLK